MNKEDQLLKLSTTLYNQLNIIWARAIEGKGACYISSMERGDIEELLKEYNETKFPSLPAPPSSPTATAEGVPTVDESGTEKAKAFLIENYGGIARFTPFEGEG